jgi:hypothetical protein
VGDFSGDEDIMKLDKLLEQEDQFLKTREEIEAWLISNNITEFTINDDLTVDADQNINFARYSIDRIKVQFGEIDGSFYCMDNGLTSLAGSPYHVSGDFICSNNKLKTLMHSPKEVGGRFSCRYNNLTDLKGAPREVSGDFECNRGNLFTEKPDYSHIKIGGEFYWN